MWMDNFAFQPFWNKDVEALLHIFSWAVTFLSEFGLQRAERWVLPCISPFLFFVDIDKFRNMNSAFFHALHDERWCLTSGDVAPWVPRPVHIGSCCSSHLSWAQLPPTETMEEKMCIAVPSPEEEAAWACEQNRPEAVQVPWAGVAPLNWNTLEQRGDDKIM